MATSGNIVIINGIEWSEEDIKMVEKFEEIRQRGFYVDGKQLTEVYNKLLGKNVNVTQCGSCLRQRVQELSDALRHYRTVQARREQLAQEELKKSQEADNKVEPNEAAVEAENKPTAKKVGRPPKKQ